LSDRTILTYALVYAGLVLFAAVVLGAAVRVFLIVAGFAK